MEEAPATIFQQIKSFPKSVVQKIQDWWENLKQKFPFLNSRLIGLGLLMVILPVTFIAAQSVQNFSQHAADNGPAFIQPKNVPILVIEYFPVDPNDQTHIDKNEAAGDQNFWLNGNQNNPDFFLLSKNQAAVDNGYVNLINFLNEASQYHRSKDASAPQYLHYIKVADPVINYTKEPTTPTNDSAPYPNGKPYIWLGSILASNNICNWVDNHGLREVWIYGYRNPRLGLPESWMSSGKYGYVSNQGKEEDLAIPPLYRMPVCNHSYTVFNYEYQQLINGGIIATMVHDHMHQLEALISYAAGDETFPVDDSGNGQGIFAGNFTLFGKNQNGCGTTHNPPNTTYANQYHYWETNSVLSNCENWPQNDYRQVSCSNWGCTGDDTNYYKWWMQNLPGYSNNISYQGHGMRNWWDLVVDFDKFLQAGKTLLCNTINCRAAPPPTGGYCAGHGGAASTYSQCGDVPYGPCNNTDPTNLNIIYHCHDDSWECDDSRGQVGGQCGVVNTNPNLNPTNSPTPTSPTPVLTVSPSSTLTPTPINVPSPTTSLPTPTPAGTRVSTATVYCSEYNAGKGDYQCYCNPVSVTTQGTCVNSKLTKTSVTWNGANCLYCGYTLKWTTSGGIIQSRDYWVADSDCKNKFNEASFFEKLQTNITDMNGITNLSVMPYGTSQATSVAPVCSQ